VNLFGDYGENHRDLTLIQRSLAWRWCNSKYSWFLGQPKTARGRRQICIPPSLTAKLLDLKRREEKAKRGPRYRDHGFVFASRIGSPLHRTSFSRSVFKVALEKAGLPSSIRLYDLRHTSATLLLKNNEHIKVVSERLGHAAVWFTLETYVHVLPGMQKAAASRLESLLMGPGQQQHTSGTPSGTPAGGKSDK
jgi:integrase